MLVADAVLFENAVVASPWTTPSHRSPMTSLLRLDDIDRLKALGYLE